MRAGKLVLSFGAVAVVAYVAGRFEMPFDGSSVAIAQDAKQGEMPAMSEEEMAKWAAIEKAGTPGEHHKVLEAMTGTWDAKYSFKMGPDDEMMTSVGTVKREWIFGGRYLEEKVEAGGFGDESFHGRGYIGYNNVDGVYEVVWMDKICPLRFS